MLRNRHSLKGDYVVLEFTGIVYNWRLLKRFLDKSSLCPYGLTYVDEIFDGDRSALLRQLLFEVCWMLDGKSY